MGRCTASVLVAAAAFAMALATARSEPTERANVNAAAVDLGGEVGFFFASQAKLGLSLSRSFFDRLEVQASLRLGAGRNLSVHEETLRLGFLFHPGPRHDILVGWRVGVAHFRVDLPAQRLETRSGSFGAITEIRYAWTRRTQLRLAPAVPIGYWNELWGFVLAVEGGVAYQF